MIIQNGTIELKCKRSGGYDGIDPVTGHPVDTLCECWGEPIPCQYLPTVNLQARDINGEHVTRASYEVLVEERPICCSEQVRLRDMAGCVIGEYSVISATPHDAVCEVRILI